MASLDRDGRLFNLLKRNYRRLVEVRFPLPRFVGGFLFKERNLRRYIWFYLKSKIYNENLLRYRCQYVGKNLMVFGSFMLEGNGNVFIGDNCTFHNRVNLFVGRYIFDDAEIRIGDNCNIAYGVTMEAAKSIRIGNNCMIAANVLILDNDSHPLAVAERRDNHSTAEVSVKPVVIEDDVWIGDRCVIMKGVTIGRGSIISAGSIVTRSVEPMKIVMSVPARTALWVPTGEETGSNPTTKAS
jgi:acetyltransferase-like isoleucine patch superfamily enzyme